MSDAATAASQRLKYTRNWIADANANPRSSAATRVNKALRDHFGIGTPGCNDVYAINDVLNDVVKLHEAMGKAPFKSHCPDQDRESPNSTSEDKRVVSAAPIRDNEFSYYPPFFQPAFGEKRQQTILHEMAHTWLGRTDVSYKHDGAKYPGCSGAAMGNADSIAWFVFDVGSKPR